jgi:hypothetical protein
VTEEVARFDSTAVGGGNDCIPHHRPVKARLHQNLLDYEGVKTYGNMGVVWSIDLRKAISCARCITLATK